MRYLLDTHVLLWARSQPEELSSEARSALELSGNSLFVSMASLWECAIKSSLGKLALPDNFYRIVLRDYQIVAIEISHIEASASLPGHHRDPFDRLIVAQAQSGGQTLITRDSNIMHYDVPILSA